MRYWERAAALLARVRGPICRAEARFLHASNISAMVNQIVFLMLADRLLLSRPEMTCLYTLMFYNVITYCISYVKELIEKEDWSPYVTLTETSEIKHLAMSATKIVLEWTKAITFIVTLTFMLLLFGLEQGLKHYKPSAIYTTITWMYYASTERIFVEMFPSVLKLFHSDIFENLEEFYGPVILRAFGIGISAVCLSAAILVAETSWKLLLLALYLNVYLRTKDLFQKYVPALQRERETMNRYRKATSEEIRRFDDVCPVCLCGMVEARATPCFHLFHPDCLRLCLETSTSCPMCKRELNFEPVTDTPRS